MEKLKEYKYIIIIALLLSGFIFYWYEYRPTKIRTKCFDTVHEVLKGKNPSSEDYNFGYNLCLHSRGL